jgi:hypothetical protein
MLHSRMQDRHTHANVPRLGDPISKIRWLGSIPRVCATGKDKMRKKSLTNCNHCNRGFLKYTHEINRAHKESRNLYCSQACFQKHRKIFPNVLSDETRSKLSKAKKPIQDLKSQVNVRSRIFKERGRKCEKCGWDATNPFTGIVPVQINHKDGDRTNNREENLEILCPNCHSMTEHFMFYGKSHNGMYGRKGTARIKKTAYVVQADETQQT